VWVGWVDQVVGVEGRRVGWGGAEEKWGVWVWVERGEARREGESFVRQGKTNKEEKKIIAQDFVCFVEKRLWIGYPARKDHAFI